MKHKSYTTVLPMYYLSSEETVIVIETVIEIVYSIGNPKIEIETEIAKVTGKFKLKQQ